MGDNAEEMAGRLFAVFTDVCDLCAGTAAHDGLPMCVHHCQADVLRIGEIEDLAVDLAKKAQAAFVRAVISSGSAWFRTGAGLDITFEKRGFRECVSDLRHWTTGGPVPSAGAVVLPTMQGARNAARARRCGELLVCPSVPGAPGLQAPARGRAGVR